MNDHDPEALARLAEYTLAEMAKNADSRGLCRECAVAELVDLGEAILMGTFGGEDETMH